MSGLRLNLGRLFLILGLCLLRIQGPVMGQELAQPAAPSSVGIKMVRLAPGEFLRGFSTDQRRENQFHLAHPFSNRQIFNHETPAHRVLLTRPLDFGVTEVTVGQFRTFVEDTGYSTDAEKKEGGLGFFPDEKEFVDRFHTSKEITWKNPGFVQSDDHPVVVVSWKDAKAFCQWLSTKEGREYRLPTEAEWEYACRASTTTWYSWGEKPDKAYEFANVADGALESAHPGTTRYQRAVGLSAQDGDHSVYTSAVGTYQANPWGLFDMHGNVWEWCEDRWRADLYRSFFDGIPRSEHKDFRLEDPLFLEATDQHQYGDWRVMRGGAWTCAPAAVRCSIRTFAESQEGSVYTGFRVVREPL